MLSEFQLLTLVVLFILLPSDAEAKTKIKKIPVEATGVAEVRSEAVNIALVEAIGMVNGKAISAQNELKSQLKTVSENNVKQNLSQKEINKRYKEATRGVVDSYQIINEAKDSRNRYVITVKAYIAKLELDKDGKRLRLAVLPFSNISQYANADGFKVNLAAALENKLVTSRKFMMLDREYQEQITQERGVAMTNPTSSIADLMKYGATVAADYIVTGEITDIDFGFQTKFFPVLSKKIKFPVGRSAVNLKIIDITTQQTKYSKNFIASFGFSDFKTLYGDGLAPNPEVAIAELTSIQIGNEILNSIYPTMVSAVNGKSITLNQGGDLIKKGAVYEVFKRGEKIYDPYTKESLGRDEHLIGTLKITRVNPKFSKAQWLDGNIDELTQSFKVGKFVIRKKYATANNNADVNTKKNIDNINKEISKEW